MDKNLTRLRRAKRARSKIKEMNVPRLSVHKTPRHIYAQIILPGGKVAAVASTVDTEIKKECEYGGNISSASIVGKYIALRTQKAGITKIAFDRSGFCYHGRIKALAEAARENGLEF